MNKIALRQTLKSQRQALSTNTRQAWDAAICAHVLAWWEAHPVRHLGIYWPMPGEPDLRLAYEALAARGVQFALPVVIDKNAPLQFVPWAIGESLKKDAFGVEIPASVDTYLSMQAKQTVRTLPEALLIPCLGFSAEHFRLGYGGGFYDRTLAFLPRPLAIGIAYAGTRVAFEVGEYDIAMNCIITECGDV